MIIYRYHKFKSLTDNTFFLFHCAQLNSSDEEGSEETMDTESQQRSTLSNEVYKQVQYNI